MNESRVWQALKESLNDYWLLYRIESSITPGFPDVIAFHKMSQRTFYIELKSWKSSTILPTFGALSTVQRNWHSIARKYGMNNFVFAVDLNGHYYLGQPDGMNPVKWTRIRDITILADELLNWRN